MAIRFFIQKNGRDEIQGPHDLRELQALYSKGTIALSDLIRDADKPDTQWKRIADCAELVTRLRASTSIDLSAHRFRREPVVPKTTSSHTLGVTQATPLGTTKASAPRKELITMLVASTALVLTVLNMGWLLLARADTGEQSPSRRVAGPEQPAKQKPTPPSPSAVRSRAEEPPPGNSETSEGNGITRRDDAGLKKEPSSALDEVMKRLDQINSRLAHLEKQAQASSPGGLLCQAIEAGALEFRVGDADFRFIFVPAGTFRFGYPTEEQNRVVSMTGNPTAFLNATPECVVTVTRGFFMLDREITVRQWQACAVDTDAPASPPAPSVKKEDNPDSPKQNVSWLNAVSFCAALQEAAPGLRPTACVVRLPTEIEWEYAGRGGQGLYYPWPPQSTGQPRFLGLARGTATSPVPVDPVRNKDCSWRGQFDFAGNLSEWCLDQYDQSLHEALAERHTRDSAVRYDPADDPIVTTALARKENDGNPSRTLRGGAVVDSPDNCELPMRRFLPQNKAAEHIGLRPVVILKKDQGNTAEGKP